MTASSSMRFHADLHIHSKHSRATSRDLDLEHLSMWACRKGLAVVGTGDFTHPAWRAELKQKLVPAEPGLFRLRPEIERDIERSLPPACQAQTRFMLTVEISTIYKKAERTRKVHHCLFAPNFDTADRISAALARIGNIASDGRPILGLDSRNLLEITLESDPGAYLIPAHIWTPWFAALGSQSGFDSIEACYGDLTPHIFAVETGLSSDPSMNWRLSQLDRYRLVSSSDAHSPAKLGREATTFDTDIDYFAIRRALETGHGYVGTVEFFPEEGKYHSDGHRKCNVRQSPAETLANGGRCLVCGDPTTVGVLHRVEALADRGEDEARPPSTAGEVSSLVPLAEMISEIASSGVQSKTVERSYDRLVSTLGAELDILEAVPVEDIARNASPLLAEAITRLRAGQVIREAGYDGEYGVIRLFDDSELRRRTAGDLLFDAHSSAKGRKKTPASAPAPAAPVPAISAPAASAPPVAAPPVLAPRARSGTHTSLLSIFVAEDSAILAALDEDQRAAAEVADGPMLIVAGPGSGKTRTLTHRMAHMIAERGVPPSACLAITFTRRAAAEMRERLTALLSSRMPGCAEHVPIHTFHSLGLTILRDHAAAAGVHPDFRVAGEAEQLDVLMGALAMSEGRASTMLRAISRAKRAPGSSAPSAGAIEAAPTSEVVDATAAYQRALRERQCVDFDDLVGLAVKALASKKRVAAACRERYRWISVDEFQDVDEQQYRLLTLLAPGGTGADHGASARANLCVIGDPNQAIYGFRGADASCFERFNRDYAGAPCVRLTRNYRSTGTIVAASSQVIASSSSSSLAQERPIGDIVREMHERITIHVAPSDRAEAELVVRTIENLMGGHDLFTLDSGRFTLFTVSSRSNRTDSFDGPGGSGANGSATGAPAEFGFADFAVLYRTDAQSAALREAFARSGIPFGKHSHDLLADQAVVRAVLDVWRDSCGNTSDRQLSLADSLRSAAAAASLSVPADTSEAGAADSAGRHAASEIAARELALQQLLRVASECGGDAARFEDALTLTTEADFWDPRADRVSLLTMHAAKGLEFPVVFIIGLEDGVVPLYWSQLDEATKAEERRLFYVGMTRAKDRLFLTRALQRLWRGRVRELPASAFLNDIEQELVKHQQMPAPRPKVEDRQLKLL
jgi:DNA helicase-2/ATP-dependent DNA helicase PcrA